jgi:hypothetical protein
MPPVTSTARCSGRRLVYISIAREPDKVVADQGAVDRSVVVGWRTTAIHSTP